MPSHTTIIDMINRYDELCRLMDQMYAIKGDDVDYQGIDQIAFELAHRIVATGARSKDDIAAKWRFIKATDFLSVENGLDFGSLTQLVEVLFSLDTEAVGATIPELSSTDAVALGIAAAA